MILISPYDIAFPGRVGLLSKHPGFRQRNGLDRLAAPPFHGIYPIGKRYN